MVEIDEQFIKEKINPVVGFIFNTARQLGAENAPDSMDMEYLRQGTEKVRTLIEEAIAARVREGMELREARVTLDRLHDDMADWERTPKQESEYQALRTVLNHLTEELNSAGSADLDGFIAEVEARVQKKHGTSMWAALSLKEVMVQVAAEWDKNK